MELFCFLDAVSCSVWSRLELDHPIIPSYISLLKLQCLSIFVSVTVLHVTRNPHSTPGISPEGPTSATTLKKSSSKTGTVSAHCTTLGLLARDPSSCRSGISLWATKKACSQLFSRPPFPTPPQSLSQQSQSCLLDLES